MPTWVFLAEPHTTRVVAVCSADPFAVETPGVMHPSTRGPIPTTTCLLTPAFHHDRPTSAVTGLGHLLFLILCYVHCVSPGSASQFCPAPCTSQGRREPKPHKEVTACVRACLCLCLNVCVQVSLSDAFLCEFTTSPRHTLSQGLLVWPSTPS